LEYLPTELPENFDYIRNLNFSEERFVKVPKKYLMFLAIFLSFCQCAAFKYGTTGT